MSRLLNLWDSRSLAAGGVGILGMFRAIEYGGGVPAFEAPCEVDGLLGPGEPYPLLDEALSLGAGDPWRDRDCRSSFNRFVRNNCSNCNLKSCAHSSP